MRATPIKPVGSRCLRATRQAPRPSLARQRSYEEVLSSRCAAAPTPPKRDTALVKSPQPAKQASRVTLLFDVLILALAPIVVAINVASWIKPPPMYINLVDLAVDAALCAWFADVERRRKWIRHAWARLREDR